MVAKPCAAGPCRSAASIAGSWLSRILGRGLGLRLPNAAAPPARQRACQLTAVWRATQPPGHRGRRLALVEQGRGALADLLLLGTHPAPLVSRVNRWMRHDGEAWLGSWPWYVAIGLTIVFLPLLFPMDDWYRAAGGRSPGVAAASTAVGWCWAAFAPRPLELPPGTEQRFANPLGLGGAEVVFDAAAATVPPAYVVLAILSAASMVVRFRRSRGIERQ